MTIMRAKAMRSVSLFRFFFVFALPLLLLPQQGFGQDAYAKYRREIEAIEKIGNSFRGVWSGSIQLGDRAVTLAEVRGEVRDACSICDNAYLEASFRFDDDSIVLPLPPHGLGLEKSSETNQLKLFLGEAGGSEFCIPPQFLIVGRPTNTAEIKGDESKLELRVSHGIGPFGRLGGKNPKSVGSAIVELTLAENRITGKFKELKTPISFQLERSK